MTRFQNVFVLLIFTLKKDMINRYLNAIILGILNITLITKILKEIKNLTTIPRRTRNPLKGMENRTTIQRNTIPTVRPLNQTENHIMIRRNTILTVSILKMKRKTIMIPRRIIQREVDILLNKFIFSECIARFSEKLGVE